MKGVADLENELVDDKGTILKTSKTNNEGSFRYDNLERDKNYMVLLNEKKPKVTNKSNFIVADVQVVGSTKKATKNLFENIYFDYDEADLRSEAIMVLDELAEYCKSYPHAQVELKSNTDNMGTNQYNIDLSKKRGEAAMGYLVGKGVDRSSLVVNAHGEAKPVATNANEMGRQLNRRIEFYILGAEHFKANGTVYILQPKNTLYSIAKENGMSVEELKRFNGLDGEAIKAYSPIRVPRKGKNTTADVTTEETVVKPNSSSEGTVFYTVLPGNTLFSVAKQFGLSVEELMRLNGMKKPHLVVGKKIKVQK